ARESGVSVNIDVSDTPLSRASPLPHRLCPALLFQALAPPCTSNMHLSNVSALILSFVDLCPDDKTAAISNKNNMRAAPCPISTS
ncbi:hypothetical protein, partial [Pseudomonas sp. GM48]|uniref:hypothetical protein n=1 Tax=Pseudomonas sp. GM48 TaxID=1144330 RepID=UPI001EE651B8